jgi:sortase (surface protein transpeptidase)
MDWFWIIWYLLLGLAVVLTWYTEFSSAKFIKKEEKKSIWQESKDRIHQQQYRSTYGTYSSKRNYGKGM